MSLANVWKTRAMRDCKRFHCTYVYRGVAQHLCAVSPPSGPSPTSFDDDSAYCVYPPQPNAVCHSCHFWWRALLIASAKLWRKFFVFDVPGHHPERLSDLVQREHAREIVQQWFEAWPSIPWSQVKL